MTRQVIERQILPHLNQLTAEQLDAVAYIVAGMARRNQSAQPSNVVALPSRPRAEAPAECLSHQN